MTALARHPAPLPRAANPLVRRLSALTDLSAAEIEALQELSATPKPHEAQTLLAPEGKVVVPQVILSGWACRQRLLRDGRCQIVNFLLPGDCTNMLMTPSLRTAFSAVSLTAVTTADAELLLQNNDERVVHPGLARAMRLMTSLDEYLLCSHVVRLGRQTAYERTVHLLLEFEARLDMAGMVSGDSFTMPLTQEVLADALGLSIVHLNRTLQQIRRDGLLELRGGRITILRRDMMEAVADWMPFAPPRKPPNARR
ncbi:MAG: Crp/Fnr family transcriptional regulator [Acetobacteraceae bacterium]